MEAGFEDDVPFSIFGDFLGSKCEISGGVSWWWKLTFKKKATQQEGAFPRPERLVQKIDDPSILKGFR